MKIHSFNSYLYLYFNTIFCSGVNIFGMISGFVGFNSHKYSNLMYLLLQTFIYNYLIAFYFKKTRPYVVNDLNHYLYPIFISDYWYFTSYFIMYFFLPLINKGIKNMTKREMEIFNLSLFLFISCFGQIKHYSSRLRIDLFILNNGYCYVWLIILYFFGSYFGRFNNKSHNYNKFLIALVCVFIILIAAYFRNVLLIYKLEHYNYHDNMLVEYTCPSYVIISICFIIMFSKLNVKSNISQKIISFFGPLTFGIYLLHNHVLVRNNIIERKYFWILEYSSFKLLSVEMLESLKIFIICSFIDYIRFLLFKLLRIKQICIFISNLLIKISNGILFLFELLY